MKPLLFVIAGMGSLLVAFSSFAQNISELQSELTSVNNEISEAQKKSARFNGGLAKALIETRIEILKTTSELIRQRIIALEGGAPIRIVIPATKPDEARATQLESEIFEQQKALTAAKTEAAEYSGGLIAAMKHANVATIEQTLSILQQEYFRSKYGLATAPLSGESQQKSSLAQSSSVDIDPTDHPARQIVLPAITNKQYDEGTYEDAIWFDAEWKAVNLKKSARSIKGRLLFLDLFGEEKFAVRVTIDDTLAVGESIITKGIGFDYNQFNDSHRWMRTTDLEDMVIQFHVESILYTDKTREDVSQ